MRDSRSHISVPLVFALVGLLATTALGEPWPRFRGLNGSGISTDSGVPVQWSEKDGVLWKAAVPGVGNSSPVVWGDKIFLQSATPDGKERLLICLGTADGHIRWKRQIPAARAYTHPRNSLASSTPATDGERVYAVFWDGKAIKVYAYDLDGTPLWNTDLGGFVSQHGAGMSPMVFGDRVIVADDQDGSSKLVALDAKSGKVAWERERQAFRCCYSTPFILEHAGKSPQLIVASTAGITSYDPVSGQENWNWKWSFSGMALRTVASPVCLGELIFANSGDGSGARHTVAIRPNGKGAERAEALVWEKRRGLPYVPTMLAHGEHLFYVNDDAIAGCIVARTGESLWTERLGGKATASPILIDGKIYAVNEAGTTFVFSAAPSFHLLAKNPLSEQVLATPAVSEGRLYIRGKEHLFCIGRMEKRTAKR